VDYFYRGFESNNYLAGIKVLETYTNDPNCLTTKRLQIEKRLKGMESLSVGTKAPNIVLKDAAGNLFDLSKAQMGAAQTLLLFYSAGCSHCTDLIKELKLWFDGLPASTRPVVIAISLDDNETYIKSWEQLITGLPDWKHLRAEGINSPVANDYFLLSTPVMILLDSKTKEILALPSSFSELKDNRK
jgi:thioredoxin-related protein